MARRPAPKKRGAAPRRRAPAQRRGVPGWLWGVAGLVAGFFLAQYVQESAPTPMATVLPKPSSSPPSDSAEESPDEPRMPTFEFYTLLPESEVVAPRSEVVVPPQPPTPSEDTASAEPPSDETVDPIAEQIARTTAADEATAEQAPTDAPSPTAESSRYMLQAASFRESGDAEQLAGRLRNFGLQAQISEVQSGENETWHRVQVGPYDDTRELNRAQDLMLTQGIEPLMIRLQN
ncbi:SPOR domain-containing protein [Halomonas sp. ML-15]|uniref:SPOR domain-containing protein n=1 Tax=Halomonas sp. ML-15 TaxID=2773305 RepID=UPI001747B704|nr:SPOR domain-containing protein [Halomonas sp. ML-15]MBD3898580.1 SPOR domain-containing protein [Halomonas sp. ML-15]